MPGSHPRSEDFPWTIAVVNHPPRENSAGYVASRKLMNTLVKSVDQWSYGVGPYHDHHGGGLWVKDADGWLCVLSTLGIEWSAIFCADPKKVDAIRRHAARIIAAFPATLPGYVEAGYTRAEQILGTEISTQEQVHAWADSIFNASLPLAAPVHTGVLPKAAGYHHYPKPIVDIEHFRYDDFQLFVTDPDGHPAAVVPVAPRGSGDGRVRLLAVHPGSSYTSGLGSRGVRAAEDPAVLDPQDPLAVEAFHRQVGGAS
jgi:hypothetical protein